LLTAIINFLFSEKAKIQPVCEIIHHGKIIKDVESSWSGIFIIYDDGSVDTFYLGGSPLVLRRKK